MIGRIWKWLLLELLGAPEGPRSVECKSVGLGGLLINIYEFGANLWGGGPMGLYGAKWSGSPTYFSGGPLEHNMSVWGT